MTRRRDLLVLAAAVAVTALAIGVGLARAGPEPVAPSAPPSVTLTPTLPPEDDAP